MIAVTINIAPNTPTAARDATTGTAMAKTPAMICTIPSASNHPHRWANEFSGTSAFIVWEIVGMSTPVPSGGSSGWWKLSVDRLSRGQLALALPATFHSFGGAQQAELAAHAAARPGKICDHVPGVMLDEGV